MDRALRAPYGHGWWRWAWRTLTSMRTAIILLTLLALAAVPGSLLPQRNVASNPSAVSQFFSQNPRIAPVLDRLWLFDVYAAPWFAAIYLLLLVSMTGCVLPRCRALWRSVRADPPRAPSRFQRMEESYRWETASEPSQVLARGADVLRRRKFRVVSSGDEVRAETGYLREVGNLTFHLSLLVLLLGVAVGRLFGFEGRVAIVEGGSFANVQSQYDEFSPRPLTDALGLEPFSVTMKDFAATFETEGPTRGQPRSFDATLSVARDAEDSTEVNVAPNSPLDINETKMFLTGHGYAPRVTVRDGRGDVTFSGSVIFLPLNSTFMSDGVVKAPDARPKGLGFEGLFLPTAGFDERGPFSDFPDTLDPRLVLTAYRGDLGLSDGVPQSVFTLEKEGLTQFEEQGRPFVRSLQVGDTMRLPDGQGSLTFRGIDRFANFQIAYDPGKEISLLAALMLLGGLIMSLTIRRRRVWLRVRPTRDGVCVVELATLNLGRRQPPERELRKLAAALGSPTHAASSTDHRSGQPHAPEPATAAPREG